MNIIEGDLLKLASEGKFDLIIHGCNCYCQMGKGIALTIKKNYPDAATPARENLERSFEYLVLYAKANPYSS